MTQEILPETVTVTGVSTAANQTTVITEIGATNEAAAGTDTATSGLNGLTKRILQKLTSLIALLPGFGTAGTPSANVVSVQGVASGTVVPISAASLPSHDVTNAGTFAVQAVGNVASGATDSGNPVKVGGVFNASLPTLTNGQRGDLQMTAAGLVRVILTNSAGTGQTIGAANVDNQSGANNWAFVISSGHLFDGTAWTRARTVINGQDSTGTGIAASGILGQLDDTSTGTVTENQFAPVRISSRRALLVEGVTSGTAIGISAASLPLPTGAATAAKQPALGTMAVPSADVLSVQGPGTQITKAVNFTTTQTGSDVWSPASGKKIAVTDLTISAYGTTAGRVILWFGDNADTTYTAGTDQVLEIASFAPSATVKSGLAKVYGITPVLCTTADRELHITTDAGMSLDITVRGYEW